MTGVWHVTVWGLPAMLGVFGLSVVVVIGVTSRALEEESREWWSRLGGSLIGVALAWTAIAAASVYAPYWVIVAIGLAQGLGIVWVLSTLGGVVTAKSRFTGKPGASRWADLIPKVTPYVFVAGLLIALSFGIHAVLNLMGTSHDVHCLADPVQKTWEGYACLITAALKPEFVFLPLVIALLVGTFLVWRVDINLFSFHMFYRNRLMRCYLGASNPARTPHLYTGFDPADSVALKGLVQRPYHLINTAINITRGERLAWQERKAASFLFSPLYCGYDLMKKQTGVGQTACYQPTENYVDQMPSAHVTLAAAFSISGAAASPNMGYHSSPAVAFLLTVFNVRLGWWMQNTSNASVWRTPGPHWGFNYLFKELAGATDENSDYVYLSDGGHFDNLGVYELVRRRCRFIIACDAGCDGDFGFEDLGNVVRKCKIDLGITIDIDTRPIVPDPQTGKSVQHCVVGTIDYSADGGEPMEGYLLYIKPSLTGNEPLDVCQYAKVNATFPHEATSDQWFGESQFESYRQLGQHITADVFESADITKPSERGEMLQMIRERWYPASALVKASFSKHAAELKALHKELRDASHLRFLDAQMYPEWQELMAGRKFAAPNRLSLPHGAEEVRAGFYFCCNLLQLMEAVYVDLNLEQEYDHPDNRGWMNLFKHWSWSSMFMVTFGICFATYGGRFQRFCERRLQMSKGTVKVCVKAIPADTGNFLEEEQRAGRLNLVEVDTILGRAEKLQAQHKKTFDELLLLRLSIKDPSVSVIQQPDSAALEFTCGFALASDGALVYFRVQDHLRRMGLARDALKAACDNPQQRYRTIADHAQLLGDNGDPPEDWRRFRMLLDSVLRELP
ncbi:MAG: hypothetical protein ABI612_18075 [Betaproteobacteria bacterium]